ncbi:MAG: tubulin-like doman-containing protein [Pirellulales bacterium]|nr:tubulin-like doman-containing protein [Pirellulales bacterium]
MAYNNNKWRPHQTVLVLIGGHAQRLIRYIKAIYPHITYVLVIDAPKEIDALSGLPHKPAIKLFHLGHGHTALTLSKMLPKRMLEKMRSLGGMAASEGMGQSILVGRLAAQELVKSRDFVEFIKQQLLPAIRKTAGGAIEEVLFLFLGSAAGGTYSGAELPVAHALATLITQFTSAIAHVSFLVTGPLTYEGLGDRILKNGAAALAELTAYVTATDRNARHIRTLRLLELSLCGIDESLRDGYLAQIEQAAQSSWLKYNLQRTAPNRAQNGRYGNIHIWEAAFGSPLNDHQHIAPVIADSYLPALRLVRDRVPSDSIFQRLEIDHDRTTTVGRTVEQILDDADKLPADSLLQELESCPFLDAAEVFVRRSASERLKIQELQDSWAAPAATLEVLDQRMQAQRRLLDLLRIELELLTQRELSLQSVIVESRLDFHRQHALLVPGNLWSHLRGVWSSTAQKLARLGRAAFAVHNSSVEMTEIKTELAALERLQATIEADFDYCHGKLVRLIKRIEDSCHALGKQLPSVIARQLDERLPELWDAIDKTNVTFMDAIRGSVCSVTMSGLALITDAPGPRVEEIAAQIASGAYCQTPAVPWGGQRRSEQGAFFLIFPPVDAPLAEVLRREVASAVPDVAIAFADSVPAVINVTAITMRLVRRLTDILTKPYHHSLREVVTDPFMESFLPNGLSTLKALGMSVTRPRSKTKRLT